MPGGTASGRDIHIDTPLSNIAIKAFAGAEGYIGPRLFNMVPVGKQSDRYYVIDRDSWLLIPNTRRAPKTAPKRIEWKVSSNGYFADNHALVGEIAKEDLANEDQAIRLRENTAQNVTEGLLRGLEDRIAQQVTSVSNVGSGVILSGANKWSDYVSSDPVADVTTGHAFIRKRTGYTANTLAIDADTYEIVRRHPVLLDMFKYTQGGLLGDAEIKSVFKVQNILIGGGIKNVANEGATGSVVNIWGNNALLAYVAPMALGPQTATFGIAFRWTPNGIPAPMQVFRYDDPDPGKKIEDVEVGYYQDEKIVATDLGYLINATL